MIKPTLVISKSTVFVYLIFYRGTLVSHDYIWNIFNMRMKELLKGG